MAPDRHNENQIFTNPLTGKVINKRITGLVGQALPLASQLKMSVMGSPLVDYAGQRLGDLRYRSGRFVSRLISRAGAALSHAGQLSGAMPGYLTAGGQRAKNSPMWQPILDLTWFQRRQRSKQNQIYRKATDISPELPLSDSESPEDAPHRSGFLQTQPGTAEDVYHRYPEGGYEISPATVAEGLFPYTTDDSFLPDDEASLTPPVTPSTRPQTDRPGSGQDPSSLLPGILPVKTPELSRGSRIQKYDSGEISGAEDRSAGLSQHRQQKPLYQRLDQSRLSGAQQIIPDHVSVSRPAGNIDLKVTGNQTAQPASGPYAAKIQTRGEPYLPVDSQVTTTGVADVVTGEDKAAAGSYRNISPVLPGEESSLPVPQASEGITARLRKVIDRVRQSVAPKRDESPVEKPYTQPLPGEEPAPGVTARPASQSTAEVRETGQPKPLQLSLHRVSGQEAGTAPDPVDSESMVSEPDTGAVSRSPDIYQGKGWLMRRVETYLPRLRSLSPVDLTLRRPFRPSSTTIQKSDIGGSLAADVGRHYQSLPTSRRREHLPVSPEEPRLEPLDSVYPADAERGRRLPVFGSIGQSSVDEPRMEPSSSGSPGGDEIDRVPPVFKPVYRSSIVDDIVYRPPGVLPGRYFTPVDDVPGDVSEHKELSYFTGAQDHRLPSFRHPVQRQPETQPVPGSREFEDEGSISEEDILSGVRKGTGYYGSREVPELALAPAGRQAETTPSAQSETRQTSGENMSEGATPEIDDIARDVYRILRRRLIRERERALGLS